MVIAIFAFQLGQIHLHFFVTVWISESYVGGSFGITFDTKADHKVAAASSFVIDGPKGGFVTDSLPMLGVSLSKPDFVLAEGVDGVRQWHHLDHGGHALTEQLGLLVQVHHSDPEGWQSFVIAGDGWSSSEPEVEPSSVAILKLSA